MVIAPARRELHPARHGVPLATPHRNQARDRRADAALICRWPGLLFDNTRDYINWGVADAATSSRLTSCEARGSELIRARLTMTPDWHPTLRRLIELTDPASCFPVNIRTSVPLTLAAQQRQPDR